MKRWIKGGLATILAYGSLWWVTAHWGAGQMRQVEVAEILEREPNAEDVLGSPITAAGFEEGRPNYIVFAFARAPILEHSEVVLSLAWQPEPRQLMLLSAPQSWD